ncbi:MAG: cell wall metabolism sensor histidine kinase WalK [Eubacterium sp.]|nr:cell wall metabolism sensor histidine kinase WalK [Eubacterium sp.]
MKIRAKVTLTFVLLLACVMLAMLVVVGVFLPRAYTFSKTETIKDAYETVNAAAEDGTLEDEDFALEIEGMGDKTGMSMLVMDSDGTVILSTGAEGELLVQLFQEVLFGKSGSSELIEEAEDGSYVINRYTDSRMNSDYIVLFGSISSGEMVMMRIAIQSINESVGISVRFILITGIIASILGAIVIFFVTKSITTPVIRISELSERMTKLDFDARYEVKTKSKNEIDELGENMNELSDVLQLTISELKTANNEMKLDLDRKEQIDQMRTDFLSNVSHELKTPLALIQGYAEGLKDCINDDEESREFYCDVIIDEADKMNKMVKRLLELNQLEFGKDEFTMERFDLAELINGVTNSMSIMLEQDNITLEKIMPDEPVFVWADEFKIEEVVTNYMSNAIHHIGGERKIVVKIIKKGESVRASVFNTGTPIAEEELSKLWEKFYKVDKSHSRQYGGNGIGLSIVKAIMDAHHRPFGVNNYKEGVEFWFELDGKEL